MPLRLHKIVLDTIELLAPKTFAYDDANYVIIGGITKVIHLQNI